jgi:hypothetical protein
MFYSDTILALLCRRLNQAADNVDVRISFRRFLALHKSMVLASGAFRGPQWFLLQEKPGFFGKLTADG